MGTLHECTSFLVASFTQEPLGGQAEAFQARDFIREFWPRGKEGVEGIQRNSKDVISLLVMEHNAAQCMSPSLHLGGITTQPRLHDLGVQGIFRIVEAAVEGANQLQIARAFLPAALIAELLVDGQRRLTACLRCFPIRAARRHD